MSYTVSEATRAKKAIKLVSSLQAKLVKAMEEIDPLEKEFKPVTWLRDEGIHGGGTRYVAQEESSFNRASVNVSHVQYDDQPEKKLASASALSAIIHPKNPLCPSTHLHFSWTEMRDGTGYWRLMADLNPSHPNTEDTASFNAGIKSVSGSHYEVGKMEGDRYFHIPALDKHRGVSHFYLEGFSSDDFDADYQFTEKVASEMIERYHEILKEGIQNRTVFTEEQVQNQIDYHTLYLYQVLTLDKGTIAGILVHNQNDLGVMGSIPARVNAHLLQTWVEKTPAPMNELVKGLVEVLEESNAAPVENTEKLKFVQVIREFYGKYPEVGQFRTGPIRESKRR